MFGSTILAYQINLCMEKAKELLLTTDNLIKDIARDVGYDDESRFINKFKEVFGVTPFKYRKNNQT